MGNEKSYYCHSCHRLYSDTTRPRILNCGHSLCCECITYKIETQRLSCRLCSTKFRATSVTDIPVNYSLENCLSAIKKLRSGLAPEPLITEKDSHSVQELIDYQKQSTQDLILSSKDLVEDLTKYLNFLHENMNKHKEIRRMIQSRAQFHMKISKRMDSHQYDVMEAKKKLDALTEKLSGGLPKLDNAYSNDDVAAAMNWVTDTYRELGNCVDSYRGDYPKIEMNLYQKLLMMSMNVLYMEDFESVKEDMCMHQCPFVDPSIMAKLNMCIIEGFVTVDNFKSNVETWKERIWKLIAASWDNGQMRVAYLSKDEDKIYLNCLSESFSCCEKYVIKHKDILTCVKSDPTVVFLELAWDNVRKGIIRILIEMYSDTPMAQHFKGLCTGELGPTFLKKKLNNVVYPNSVTERIISGPCKGSFFHGDISQDTLGFNSAVYKRQANQGIVWMDTNLSFSILTGVGRGCMYNNVFGRVTDGLDLLIDAAEYIRKGLGKVEIFNSGVVLEI
ncbi:uncharacterized protein LOC135215150 [Macrobrachium nipponense]|uniref:uncharacterized protein LOC135215150 n=1 Tax=Macrobrachium nipponense TaxID=159736 RepID=UPI0030C7E867